MPTEKQIKIIKHLTTKADKSLPLERRRAMFVAGDDSEAKAIVARLIEEVGFAAVDTGLLHEGGRRQQPGTAVYNRELTAGEAGALLWQPESWRNRFASSLTG